MCINYFDFTIWENGFDEMNKLRLYLSFWNDYRLNAIIIFKPHPTPPALPWHCCLVSAQPKRCRARLLFLFTPSNEFPFASVLQLKPRQPFISHNDNRMNILITIDDVYHYAFIACQSVIMWLKIHLMMIVMLTIRYNQQHQRRHDRRLSSDSIESSAIMFGAATESSRSKLLFS